MRGCGKSPVLNQGGSEVGLWVSGINADAAGVLLRIQREQGQTTKEKDRFHMKLSGEIILLDIWSARGVTNRAAKRGRLQDAVAEYQASLRVDPHVAEVHYELAYALAQIPGRLSEAIVECQEMLRISPNDEPGRQLMASTMASDRRPGI